ncbi:MAG: diheme cytochrome c [Sulfurovaceae bacterium]
MYKKIIIPLILISGVYADDDRWSNRGDVAPVKNAIYVKECGSCHFPYQPGLLPQRSWTKMMGNLENHFSSDASLDDTTTKYLVNYLKANSAERGIEYKRSRKILQSIRPNETPLRITQTRYFVNKHNEIPKKMIVQKAVGSLANCAACHTTANKGNYSERAIKIPNYGMWEDD